MWLQAADLVKLFLRPNADVYSCWRRRAAAQRMAAAADDDDEGPAGGADFAGLGGDDFDDEDGDLGGGAFDDGFGAGAADGAAAATAAEYGADAPIELRFPGLVQRPARRVQLQQLNFSRAPKFVDVKALKELLWCDMEEVAEEQGATTAPGGPPGSSGPSGGASISFQQVISKIPELSAAGKRQELTMHLCFICLLHLANENGLAITNNGQMNALQVSMPK